MLQKKNFCWLFFALLGYLIVAPVAEDMGVICARLMRVIMFSWLFVFGVWSLRGFGRFFHAGWHRLKCHRRKHHGGWVFLCLVSGYVTQHQRA